MKNKMKHFYQNLLFTLSIILFVILLTFTCLFVLGYKPFILKSSSMEPLYHKNDLVIVDTKTKVSDTNIGDIYVYRTNSGMLVMHRLIAHNKFKGDTNQESQYVNLKNSNLIGEVKYSLTIPFISTLVSNKNDVYSLAFCFLLLSCLPSKIRKNLLISNH